MRVESPSSGVRPLDRFHRFCVAVVARLPLALNSVVAPTFLGFVLINRITFGFDLLLLARTRRTAVHGVRGGGRGENYLAFILGVSGALTALGVDFRLARILAACCEAVYMYSAMRWVVFRR